jgi:PqqD family protein of HPr-rel-A system
VTRGARLLWSHWEGDEYVVFSDLSGDTHLVNQVTAEVLRQLEQAALETTDLARRVAKSLGTDSNQQFESSLERLLEHLDQIGLIEPVP